MAGDLVARCFLPLFFLCDVDGQGEEYATRVARCALEAVLVSPGAVEAAVPELGSTDGEVSLGLGVGDGELEPVDVDELGDEGAVECVDLGDEDGVGAVSAGTGFDELQLLGLVDAEPVAPGPELFPTAPLERV